MTNKSLWKISLVCAAEAEDAFLELLQTEAQQPSVSYTDVETTESTVASYHSIKPEWSRLRPILIQGISRIRSCGLNVGRGKLTLQKIRREDWAESWKRHFKALQIGKALLIKPSWSRQAAKKDQATVILDPGLSFGTGQHPTTSFCLRHLAARRDRVRASIPSLLDIGTGSGILAIAAAKLGYAPIDAFDFDPESVRVATDNARKNHVFKKLRIHRADLTKLPRNSSARYDVVCANLISTLLLSERNRILNRLKPDGVLIIAGILASEFNEVQTHYEQAGMRLAAARTEKEWRSGIFSRL